MPASAFETVLTAISRYNMLSPGRRVLAAVSGGADSVFLIHALLELAPRFGASVSGVAHLNHKLRGEDSDADAVFVAALARSLGLAFYGAEAHVAEAGGNLEAAARRARREFFAALLREGAGDCVATGHTRDDQAETVLFRILRGSGGAGLAGILPVTKERIVRPLIETSRAAIEDLLSSRGIGWREDSTNRNLGFARNRIRHELLPALEREWNPQLPESLAHTAALAFEEERWWGAQIRRLATQSSVEVDGGLEVPSRELSRLPRAVSRRLARELIRRAGGRAPAFEHVEQLLELASSNRGSGCLELPGLTVIRSFDWLRLAPSAPRPRVPQSQRFQVAPGFRGCFAWGQSSISLQVSELPPSEPPLGGAESRDSCCVRLKWKGHPTTAVLELRAWKNGDHYRPWSQPRDQKLKEMFQNARVPSWKRMLWPIVTNGSNILWARGFGVAAGAESGHGAWLWIREEPNTQPSTKKDVGQ